MILALLTPSHLSVSGHARHGLHQGRAVCAAVSALVGTYRSFSRSAPDLKLFPRRPTPAFKFLVRGLKLLAMRYPLNIQFEVRHGRSPSYTAQH